MNLDTLYLLFKGDTSNLKASGKEAEGVIADYIKSVTTADLVSNKLGASLTNIIKKFALYAASYASLNALVQNVRSATEYSETLFSNARALNLNAETLGIWENAVTKAGGSASAFESTIAHLSSHFNITQAGIIKSLPAIADLFSKLSNFRAQKLAGMLGIDQGTLYLLQKGSKGIQEAIEHQKHLGVVTKKDTEIAHAFYQEWGDMKQAFRSFFVMIATDVLPGLTKVVHGFTEFAVFMRTHKDLLIGGIVGIATVTTALLIPSLVRATAALFTLELAGAPFIVVLAAIGAAIALAVEDFLIYKKGGDSVTGALVRWTNAHPGLIKVIEGLGAALQTTSNIMKIFLGLVDDVTTKLDRFFDPKGRFTGLTMNEIAARGQANADFDMQNRANLILQAQNKLNVASSNVFTSVPSGNLASKVLNSRSVTITIGDINVQTQATDGEQTANDVHFHLQTLLEQAVHANMTGQMI